MTQEGQMMGKNLEREPILQLPRALRTQLFWLAQEGLPNEVVGLLAGPSEWSAGLVLPLRNIAENPSGRFMAEPHGLLEALFWLQQEQLELVAIYHSHPVGPALPSNTDLETSWDVPALIIDPSQGIVRAWNLQQRLELGINIT